MVDDSGCDAQNHCASPEFARVKDIAEAGDGIEALEVFGNGDGFDLILTDWNMPRMNGLEFVQSIRQAGHTVPIMMITTETEKDQVLKAIQAGVNDYLVKPFDQEMLTLKLQRVVPNPTM